MLVLCRIELTPSIFKAPNLYSANQYPSAKNFCTPSSTIKKEKKLNQTFSPVWVTFHAALKVEMCLLNWNDYRFFPPVAKTIIVTRNAGSKGKEKLSDRGCLVITWQNTYQLSNWDWFVSKLWQDQLRQTTFAGEVGRVASPRDHQLLRCYYGYTQSKTIYKKSSLSRNRPRSDLANKYSSTRNVFLHPIDYR